MGKNAVIKVWKNAIKVLKKTKTLIDKFFFAIKVARVGKLKILLYRGNRVSIPTYIMKFQA